MKYYMKEKWHRHFGVYGICVNEKSELLVILKNGGPYTGRYDLPGGALENPETLKEGIRREFLEETGMEVELVDNMGCYEILNDSAYNGYSYTHHIAAIYRVNIVRKNVNKIRHYVGQNMREENDSMGKMWIKIDELKNEQISPLVKIALDLLRDDHEKEIELFWGKQNKN